MKGPKFAANTRPFLVDGECHQRRAGDSSPRIVVENAPTPTPSPKTKIYYLVCIHLSGHLLDTLARMHLWTVGLDYMHGTGHGVGAFLCVHEGPCGISYKSFADEPLEEGMIITDGEDCTQGCKLTFLSTGQQSR